VEGSHSFASSDNDGLQTVITVQLKLEVDLESISNSQHQDILASFVGAICKTCLVECDFKQVGRLPRFFDTSKPDKIERHNLEVWQGYSINPEVYRAGMFFNIDAVTKFIQTKNVLGMLSHMKSNEKLSYDQMKDRILRRERRVPGFTVITKWGKQLSYQIDDIAFDLDPTTYKFFVKGKLGEQPTEYSLLEYFKEKFPQTPLAVQKQPLLVVHKKEETIYLPPELCFIPNLPDDFTKNSNAMRDLQQYKSFDPTNRYDRICKMASQLSGSTSIREANLQVDTDMITVKGRYLQDLTMKDPGNTQQRFKFADYTRGSFPHSEPMKLEDGEWAIVYAARDTATVNEFVGGMRKAQGRMGIKLGEPEYIEIENSGKNDYISGFKQLDPNKTKIALVLLQREQDKHVLKSVIDGKVGVPSQFVLFKTAQKACGALAVAGNILKQMNAKIARDLYRINFSNSQDTMVVGVNAINYGKGMLFALVATYSASLSQCFTYIDKIELG